MSNTQEIIFDDIKDMIDTYNFILKYKIYHSKQVKKVYTPQLLDDSLILVIEFYEDENE